MYVTVRKLWLGRQPAGACRNLGKRLGSTTLGRLVCGMLIRFARKAVGTLEVLVDPCLFSQGAEELNRLTSSDLLRLRLDAVAMSACRQ